MPDTPDPIRGALLYRGQFLGIEPGTTTVYADRPVAGEWELAEFLEHHSGFFSVRFVAANRLLTITPDGTFESRPAAAPGAWETFYAAYLPPDDQAALVSPHGVALQILEAR